MDGFSKKIRIQQIIWLALFISILICSALPLFILDSIKQNQEFLSENLLYAISGSLAAGSLFLSKIFLEPSRLIPLLKKQDHEESFPNLLLIPNIISWAFNEAIAILGLLNYMLTNNQNQSYQLAAIAIALHLLTFPSLSKAQNLFENTKIKLR